MIELLFWLGLVVGLAMAGGCAPPAAESYGWSRIRLLFVPVGVRKFVPKLLVRSAKLFEPRRSLLLVAMPRLLVPSPVLLPPTPPLNTGGVIGRTPGVGGVMVPGVIGVGCMAFGFTGVTRPGLAPGLMVPGAP